MTEQEQKQAKALYALMTGGKLPPASASERGFLTHMDNQAWDFPQRALTDRQASWLRAIVWTYRDELTDAGERDLIYSAPAPKAK